MSSPADSEQARRTYEEFAEGQVFELGTTRLSQAEIIDFARRFDPQPFHVDPVAAQSSMYGGLIASGLQTLGAFTRPFVEHVLNPSISFGSPGFDKLRWPAPVRPDDELRVRWTVLECRESRSRPELGIVRGSGELQNQLGETVLTVETVNFIGRRPSAG
jgi:acyl dehydratase